MGRWEGKKVKVSRQSEREKEREKKKTAKLSPNEVKERLLPGALKPARSDGGGTRAGRQQ